MGESGKRRRSHPDDRKNQKRRSYTDRERDEMVNDELIVYRILCPDDVIGSVIGKSGKVINSIRQDSRAKVKVLDPFPGAKERVIIIYCYVKEKENVDIDEELNDGEPLCFAQDALLKVHAAIVNALAMNGESDRKKRDRDIEQCRLLVPSSQSSNIIGKSGATIKKLRNKTRTNIKITAKDTSDPADSCALEFDNFLLISGESEAVKKALLAVSAIMYKFTPKESIPLYTSTGDAPPSIIIPSDIPMYPAAGLYPRLDAIAPARSATSILGASHLPSDIPGYADSRGTWPIYTETLPMVPVGGGASQSEELIIKVLCPSSRIGRVIGKGGSSIRSIRQDTGALIDVEDPKTHSTDCIVTLTSTESSDDLRSTAVEAVLLLQGKINNEDDDTATMRLLVPSKVIGCIIGRSGSIINEIRKRTKTDIRISKSEKPKSADENDELVEISGQVGNLRDALVQIVLRLRDDVLNKREDVPNSSAGVERLYSGSSSFPAMRSLPPSDALAYERRTDSGSRLGLLSASGHGYESLLTRDDGYGSLSSHSPLRYSRLPPPSTLEMIIPAHAVGKVMGKGGANIENIRKISGAAVEISDSRSSRGDRVALISGTSEQKRAAENLIQAFIMAT